MYLAAWFEAVSSLFCVSGFHSASLNLPANGCTAWGWKTSSQLPTPASAQSISGPTASGTTTANSFWGRMQCPPYSPIRRIRQRWGNIEYSSLMVCCQSKQVILFDRLNFVKEGWYQRRQTLSIQWEHKQTETERERPSVCAETKEEEWGWVFCDCCLYCV